MGWYQVTKTIKGIPYRYRQRTWRENGRAQTESVYLGRADSAGRVKRSASIGSGSASTIATEAALAEYDRLMRIARDFYDRSCTSPDAERKMFYQQYLAANAAVREYQAKALDRDIPQWGGAKTGGELYRRDFENALTSQPEGDRAIEPAEVPKKSMPTREAALVRAASVAKIDKACEALAEYDRLVGNAQDLYEKSNRASNEDYEKAFGEYLQSKNAVTAHQSKALGRVVNDGAGGEGGIAGDMYRKEFEDALTENGNGKKSKPPRPPKIKVPERLPVNGDFSGPFWDTPHTPEHLRDQASLYYKEYLKVKARCDAYHALDVSSWQAARTGKARLSELQSQLAWYEGKCRSWFDRKIVFTKSRVILKENA